MGKVVLIPEVVFSKLSFGEFLGRDPDLALICLPKNQHIIETVEQTRPDVVVLHPQIQEFNPFDCCKVIKNNSNLKETKVIFVVDQLNSPWGERARSVKTDLVVDANHAVEKIQSFLHWEWIPFGKIERRMSTRYVMEKPVHLDCREQLLSAIIVDASRTGLYLLSKVPIPPKEVLVFRAKSLKEEVYSFPIKIVRRSKLTRPLRTFTYGLGAKLLRPPDLMAEEIKQLLMSGCPKLAG